MTAARKGDGDATAALELAPLVVCDASGRTPEWATANGWRSLAAKTLDAAGGDAERALAAASCALVDATTPRFVHSARALHAADSSVQVIAVAPAAELASAQRALLFAPGLGEVWLASASEVGAALTDRAGGVTLQRRRFARTRARIDHERLTESPQRTARALVSDAYLAGLLRALPDAVFSVSTTGRVLSGNAAAERLFGADVDGEVAGRRLAEVLGTETCAPGEEPALLARAAAGGAVDITFRSTERTSGIGELRAVLVERFDITRAVDRSTDVWAVVLHDVTDERMIQEQLRDNAMQLEAQTEELRASTEELAERTAEAERLRDVAEAASRARSDFLATMSHEIRTPINAIIGYTQLLDIGVPDPVSPAQRAQLARVSGAASHLLGLVDDVLDVAKVDAGEMRVARELAHADRVVADALALTRPLAQQRDIRILEDDHANVSYVGDEARVRQILVNLLSNAVKFTPAGGHIAIACGNVRTAPAYARVEGDGPWTFMRIADTGIGIAPDQQSSVFEPFVQAESGRTRTKGGTGLGLTISRRLARLMGGDLTLESIPGNGTTFTLWLPATDVSPADTAETAGAQFERAVSSGSTWRVRGLSDAGLALRESIDAILATFVAQLRADPQIPAGNDMGPAELEDHAFTMLADMAQSLVIIAEAGDSAPGMLSDSNAIQRAIAEAHGARRFAQRWSEAALRRELDVLQEVTERAVEARVADRGGDVSEAVRVLAHLGAQARALSVASYIQARWRAHTAEPRASELRDSESRAPRDAAGDGE